MFDPDDKISGGQGFIHASSIVVAMRKLKLKEDEDGNKVSDVRGIRAACKVMKTRYSNPLKEYKLRFHEQGMDPTVVLLICLKKQTCLKNPGNRHSILLKMAQNILSFVKTGQVKNLMLL